MPLVNNNCLNTFKLVKRVDLTLSVLTTVKKKKLKFLKKKFTKAAQRPIDI